VRNATKIFVVTAAGAVVAATIGVTVAKTGHLYIANAISFAVGIATGALLNSLTATPFVR
jgi:uncharacterized membrane protein